MSTNACKILFNIEGGVAVSALAPAGETLLETARKAGVDIDAPCSGNGTDIDSFIRAKGAIFSAIRTMLAIVDFPVDAIEEVYVAGGLGSGLNVEKAKLTGNIENLTQPKIDKSKLSTGNFI
ncbi:MAG: ASKHA domain-containing protein [Treponema sp.]|jgi:uncharacterized 2Fe-2S/4Fe-4S cluster protein (DUF4445 family)|nr:ASKHA domain-containing protein [Treponema sp.]